MLGDVLYLMACARPIGLFRSSNKLFKFFEAEGAIGTLIRRKENLHKSENKEIFRQLTPYQNLLQENEKYAIFAQQAFLNCYFNSTTLYNQRIYKPITELDNRREYGLPGIVSYEDCLCPESISPLLDEEKPNGVEIDGFQLSSVLKKRRKKMNKHKYKKRIHRDKAKIRTVKYFRLRRKKRRQAHGKRMLIAKIKKVLAINPKSDLPNRPYVIHRLKNW